MRIESSQNYVELLVSEVVPSGLPAPGDVGVDVKAEIEAFSGASRCRVEEAGLDAFAIAARHLFSSLEGAAQLESMSPDEFSPSLSPANSRGYVLVGVAISRSMPLPRAVSGEFEVELSALADITSWLEAPYEYA